MTSKVDKCLEILNLCSLDEKKGLLEILKVLTHNNQGSVNDSSPSKNPKHETSENFSYERYVSYHSSFLNDESFLNDLRFELNSMVY